MNVQIARHSQPLSEEVISRRERDHSVRRRAKWTGGTKGERLAIHRRGTQYREVICKGV